VANRHAVTVSLDPFGGDAPSLSATVPLFVLILLLLVIGVFMGSFSTWLSQGRWRNRARRLEAELRETRAERAALAAQVRDQDQRSLPHPAL
jgi:uncharacterized protein YlxW (UPF0749 family)